MFEKKLSIEIENFETFMPGLPGGGRVKIFGSKLMLIANNQSGYSFRIYERGRLLSSFECDFSRGHLIDVKYFDGLYWLEFHDYIGPYEQDYVIAKSNGSELETVGLFPRESYMHELDWHCLFIKEETLCLHVIRHNRLHHYVFSEDSFSEMDVMEGGRWYLAGSYPICIIGASLEIYDANLSLCAGTPLELDIDDLKHGFSLNPPFLAFTLTDIAQEQTALFTYQPSSQVLYSSYLEHAIADMGLSGGRIWLNPYEFSIANAEFGGVMVYDRSAAPLYTHMRLKSQNGQTFGSYPPPFHRSEGIYALPDGLTLVAEVTRLKVFDYNCHNIQEIGISHTECFGISADGTHMAILHVDRNKYLQEGVNVHPTAELTFYEWNLAADGGKVIEMLRFT